MDTFAEEEMTFREADNLILIKMEFVTKCLDTYVNNKTQYDDFEREIKKVKDISQYELVYNGQDILYPYICDLCSTYQKVMDAVNDVKRNEVIRFDREKNIELLENTKAALNKMADVYKEQIDVDNDILTDDYKLEYYNEDEIKEDKKRLEARKFNISLDILAIDIKIAVLNNY